MKVTATTTPARKSTRLTLRSVLKGGLLLLVLGVLLAIAALVVQPEFTQRAAAKLEQRWGYAFRSVDAGLMEQWSIALGVYLREALDGMPEIPELVIDVPFKEISKIYAKREEALERGILVQGPDDFVKGEVRLGERFVPVKLRLKGDWNDHLAGRKWSFRIRTRGGDQLLGMRRFSIQNPATRGYQAEPMFFDVLKRYDVLSPRYSFAQVTLNGESMGLMALEEFFAKELLESSRRREGVIVRFDESNVWDSRDSITGDPVGWGGAFDDYRNARVDAFGSAKIAESPVLAKQYAVARSLLNGFVDGTRTASAVFDADRLGAYIAVADLFGSWHAVAWHNLRFYLNPVTLKLEPIAFDATLIERFEDQRSVVSDEPMMIELLRDPIMFARYMAVLDELDMLLESGELEAQLRATENLYLPLLRTEFRMLGRFPTDYLRPRLDALLEKARAVAAGEERYWFLDPREQTQYTLLAHFSHDPVAEQLIAETAVPRATEVRRVEWVANDSDRRAAAVPSESLPLTLPARGIGAAPERIALPLLPPPAESETWRLEIAVGFVDREWSQWHAATPRSAQLTGMPLPQVSDPNALPFIELSAGTWSFTAGDWRIERDLVTPPGVTVVIPAGTTLRIAPDALILVNGPLQVLGDEDARVKFLPATDSWPGLVVMNAGGPSVVRYGEFRSTHSVSTDNWTLTGGVNFYASDVTISDTLFADSRGEDALNIISSRYELNNITVDGTVSDAFDGDFTEGAVNGGLFTNIGSAGGGDAVDVSGSNIAVNGTRFVVVADKALSVGERSTMQATGVAIAKVGTGAAAKDGSRLEISDSNIDGATFAGMTAYIKKPEYGPAEIRAEGVAIVATERPVLVQTGSRASVDGEEVVAEDVDVDALYETVMRPGLRR